LAARLEVTVTDMQVIESLASSGPATAGQLAELTGLTTGAITGMINRLEEARLVQRERDPEDGRRVIVRLTVDAEQLERIAPVFKAREQAWEELTGKYDDAQIAVLLDFLRRVNAVARQEIGWLREGAEGEGGVVSAPLGTLESGRLVVSGALGMTVRAGEDMTELYQARFEGPEPEVKAQDGVVTMHYPRRLWGGLVGGKQRAAVVTLNGAIPWYIELQGGASMITAELAGLNLAGLEVKGGGSVIRLALPAPLGQVPIQISGGASVINILRPAGVAARVHLKGSASVFTFDDQTLTNSGSNVRLQSPGYDATDRRYDIEVASSASMVTITTG
jgi:DNA-binding MarR family transcriptional regulator